MNNPLGVSPSKGNQGTTRGKENIFWPRWVRFPTNEQKGIRHHITCSSSNLVYMIQCTKCRIPYIGETKRRLSDRFGEHRRTVEKAITQRDIDQPTAVSDHFTLPGHSLNNWELIPLELINSNRDAIRKAREAFLIYKGTLWDEQAWRNLIRLYFYIFITNL